MSDEFRLIPGRPKSNSVGNKMSQYKSASAAAAAYDSQDRTESGDIED